MLLLQKGGAVKESGVYGLFNEIRHGAPARTRRREGMLTTAMAGIIAAAIAMAVFRQMQTRIARARRMYDTVLHTRRLPLGASAGAVFRRPAI
jgi:uncharacterized membrane protein YeaQ/YmgE (transglycosylase-associated protein family)